MFSLNLKGNLFEARGKLIMGILNITPDSFFTSNWNSDENRIISIVEEMLLHGLDILDIGGQSTRPGSTRISAEEEMDRILPAIKLVASKFPQLPISVDTYQCRVAEEAVRAGAHIINDISGGDMDPGMISTVAQLGVPYICMHMQGTPETMQKDPTYTNVVTDVIRSLAEKIKACEAAGIKDIIVDPGFGFGKNTIHNFELLRGLPDLRILGKPILAGLSRKATIYKTLGVSVDESLNGTTVMNTIAMLNGADIIRVHDVKEANEARKLVEAYKKTAP